MKSTSAALIVLFFIILSCKKDDKQHYVETQRDLKKKEIIFANINKSWVFNSIPSNPTAQNLTTNWTEWRIFLDEISRKPKSTILAFQQKAKNLSQKAADLRLNIPAAFKNPALKSRISVLLTKVNMLELYINLSKIPDNKVIELITQINIEINALQLQMNEITVKSEIKVEEGEEDLIRMMDTTRAVPSVVPDPTLLELN